ncbi:MAG TPA: sugar-binding protein, partial [Sedimentisphaerales bacterium]|nr:sugar-binding protein [Sedimentisphaerales bacterium]
MFRNLMYLIAAVAVLGLAGNVFAQESAWDFYIPYAFEPPVLDGQVDAVWASASTQEMTVPINGTVDSPLDAGGHWQVMWDSEYLYLIVEIVDSQLVNDTAANNWRDDSIEFYFDGGNTKEEYAVAGALSGDNRQYNFGWTTDAIQGTNANTTGVEHVQVNTPTGWRHEMRLPWMSLQGKAPQVGDLIGIDCFFNDDDDGGDTRETQLATFADDNGDWRNPADWGTAILVMGESNIAYGPSPANGAVNPATWAQLSWKPGPTAVSHDVYIGDNFDDVNAGAANAFWGNLAATSLFVGFPSYPYPNGLVPGTTYYWRIDEVNDAYPNSPWKGSIWSFSIPPKTAYDPTPADGVESVALNVSLTWTTGYEAKFHTVYFDDNFDDVNSATAGTMVATTTYNPGPLKPAKVYYWRVDETDPPATYKGQVWSFTTLGAVGNPYPSNGAGSAEMNVILSWTPGDDAASHQLYFGMDKEAVRKANTASPEYKGARA